MFKFCKFNIFAISLLFILLIMNTGNSEKRLLTYNDVKKNKDKDDMSLYSTGFRVIKKDEIKLLKEKENLDMDWMKKDKNYTWQISSSSFLKEGKINHTAYNLLDGNPNTVWVEGVKGFGFKEWIKLKIVSKKKYLGFSYLVILPGFAGSEKLFKANNRPKSMVISIDVNKCEPGLGDPGTDPNTCYDIFPQRLKFKDKNAYHIFGIFDRFFVGKEVEITLYIEDVYKGTKYDDTCVAEIFFVNEIPNHWEFEE